VAVSKPIDIAEIGKRVRRAAWQDGILELLGGLFFMFYAVIVDDLARGVRPHSAVMVFMLLICAWPLVYLAVVRSAFTYPRMGYVETKLTVTARHVAVLMFFLLLPLVTFVGVQFLSHTFDVPLMLRWMSVALGCVLGGLYFALARSQGDQPYLVLAAAMVVLGIVLSQVTRGTSVLLVLNSAVLFLYGIYKLVRFVLRHPPTGADGAGMSSSKTVQGRDPDPEDRKRSWQ